MPRGARADGGIYLRLDLGQYRLQVQIAQRVDLFVQAQDFQFGLQVHLIVVGGGLAVLFGLAVLRHHDDRRLERGQHRQDQVEQDEGVGVRHRIAEYEDRVEQHPGKDQQEEEDDEGP